MIVDLNWQTISKREIIELRETDKERNTYTYTKIYLPPETIGHYFEDGNYEVNLRRYALEEVKRDVEIPVPSGTVKSLIAGIEDKERFSFLEFDWIEENDPYNTERITIFYFRNEQPADYENMGNRRSLWPEDYSSFMNMRIKPFIDELAAEMPGVADSLWKCLRFLVKSEELSPPQTEVASEEKKLFLEPLWNNLGD